jgi:hypothetical protein
MTDRWEEALQLKGLIETGWQRLEAEV